MSILIFHWKKMCLRLTIIILTLHSQFIHRSSSLVRDANSSASPNDLKTEISELRLEVGELTKKVVVLNNYVVSSFEKLFNLFDSKATKKKEDGVPVSEKHQSVDDDDTYDHDGYQHFDDHDFVANVPEGNMPAEETKSHVKENEGVIGGEAN
ncbi:uncharacterized protein LOC132061476 [Lycium ferocissimum]|uniref:uncharacterized protein LOC132061476 n=1 Tax=Lycium ferocissimum TaxID=112874 RepID=UPI002815F995|nr:uncharacterized protein LOC132061476 [Lycium ferocissimum]